MRKGHNFYVYALLYDDGGVPFYIGKGRSSRWNQHEANAKYGARGTKHDVMREVIAQHGYLPKVKLVEQLCEADAYAEEARLIVSFGRRDLGLGPLLNQSDGGEGCSGRVMPAEQKKKISDANSRPDSVAARREEVLSRGPEWRVALSLGQRRARSDPKVSAKLSKIRENVLYTPEVIARRKANHAVAMANPETGRRVSEGIRRQYLSDPDGAAKKSAAGKIGIAVRRRKERDRACLKIALLYV